VLANLSLEQRVRSSVFCRGRLPPTFGYLSADDQNALLRAMASDEAAAL
jgi:hypothetical protein